MTVSPSIRSPGSPDPRAREAMGEAARSADSLIELTRMHVADLTVVEATERAVYAHPWSLTNFRDSVASGYDCWVARDRAGFLAGYFLLMVTPDEAHLLNLTVQPALHGRGIGRLMIERACTIGREKGVPAMLLEVRPSNTRALAVYQHLGFSQIGIRKRYYPAAHGQREDAIVMRLAL